MQEQVLQVILKKICTQQHFKNVTVGISSYITLEIPQLILLPATYCAMALCGKTPMWQNAKRLMKNI